MPNLRLRFDMAEYNKFVQLNSFIYDSAPRLITLHSSFEVFPCFMVLKWKRPPVFFIYFSIRYLKNPKDLKCHLGSLVAASLAVLSKETGIMALAINISYGAAHMTFYRPRPGRKTSSSRKIAFKRISTDAFMVRFSFWKGSLSITLNGNVGSYLDNREWYSQMVKI